jgi:hypothetical protein
LLSQLSRNLNLFGFITGYQKTSFRETDPVNLHAANTIGQLHDELYDSGFRGHALEIFLVRIVYCLFADDTGIFQTRDQFHFQVSERARADGGDLGPLLSYIFQVLNTPAEQRSGTMEEELRTLPYVNGGLFREVLPIPSFNVHTRNYYDGAAAYYGGALAVHPDGTIYRPEISNSGTSAQVSALDGLTGTTKFVVSIPSSVGKIFDQCWGNGTGIFAGEMGPIRVATNGTAYFEVLVSSTTTFDGPCDNRTTSSSATSQLLLYGVQSNGSVTSQVLQSSSGTSAPIVNLGSVIDDGQGGALATWTIFGTDNQYTTQVMDIGGQGGQYTLPLINPEGVLLGENNKAYATDGSSIVQFDVNNGPEWTWNSPTYGIALVTATAGGGVAAEDTTTPGQLGSNGGNLYTLDSSGNVSTTTVAYNSDYYGDGVWISDGKATGPSLPEGSAPGGRPEGDAEHNS